MINSTQFVKKGKLLYNDYVLVLSVSYVNLPFLRFYICLIGKYFTFVCYNCIFVVA